MDEAIGMLKSSGNQLDVLRVRAFPFHHSVDDFIADHDFVFVVEQNRDGQLRSSSSTNAPSTPRAWWRSCITTVRPSPRASSPAKSAKGSVRSK
jgi:hypothetical protein